MKQSAAAVLGAYIQRDSGEQNLKNVVWTPNLWMDQITAVTLVEKEGQYYFFCEDYSVARSFGDGLDHSCWIMQYRDHSIQYVCSYTQTDGGSADFMYTGYKFENGACVSADLYYSECYDVPAPYDHFGEAMTAFFQDYGIEIDPEVQKEAYVSDGYYRMQSVLPEDEEHTILFQLTNKQICFVAQDALCPTPAMILRRSSCGGIPCWEIRQIQRQSRNRWRVQDLCMKETRCRFREPW